jgi:hypothetical protein
MYWEAQLVHQAQVVQMEQVDLAVLLAHQEVVDKVVLADQVVLLAVAVQVVLLAVAVQVDLADQVVLLAVAVQVEQAVQLVHRGQVVPVEQVQQAHKVLVDQVV